MHWTLVGVGTWLWGVFIKTGTGNRGVRGGHGGGGDTAPLGAARWEVKQGAAEGS